MEGELTMAIGDEFKSSGITTNTPKNVMLGAGTVHKGLTFGYLLLTAAPADWTTGFANYYTRSGNEGSYTYTPLSSAATFAADTYYRHGWNFETSLICATSGGNKLSIVPELYDIPVDGALVKVKGLTAKIGESASLEINPVEITPEMMKNAVIGNSAVSATVTGYTEITSRADIATGDYLENMAFVGKTLDGRPIIIIFDNALCTSGLELEGKNKEAAIPKFKFECYAALDSDATKLPYHIYYPTPVVG